MKGTISLVFAMLLVGLVVPAFAQSAPTNVVINEVDINPPGDDSQTISEWVELYNPTNSDVNVGGWKIASTTVLKKTMTIPDGTIIKPGSFLTYSYQNVWFTDSSESVELRDTSGVVVDKTPTLSDIQNDFKSWQRIYDGFDSNDPSDWKFATSTAGSSNGKLIESQTSSKIVLTASTDKSSYLFGEKANISGSVSEKVFIQKPFFQPEPIMVTITGPNYKNTLTLYPDFNLKYKTTLSLHQVLGINQGDYDVTVTYAGVTANTSFSVGTSVIEKEQKADTSLSIITDKSQYIPGQLVTINAYADEIISFEGLKFAVTDPKGKIIASGNLYPTKGEFKTTVFLNNVNPVFGTYELTAEYFDKSASTTFEVAKDFKEDVPISLWTDKPAYGLGDQVKITGRLNQIWISFLNLEITQTKQTSIVTSASSSGFKILDGVQVNGDGTFSYTFKIPDNKVRLGDYKIQVSKDIGSATKIIQVVSNPDEFVASDEKLTVETDKPTYSIGDTMTINGFVKDPYGNSSYQTGIKVGITISHEDGSALSIIALPNGAKTRTNDGVVVGYTFSAVPETSGRYSLQVKASPNVFAEGNYVIKAEYLDETVTKKFSITNPLNIQDGPVISLDKDVYGLGEKVQLTGILPRSGASAVDITLTKPDGTQRNSGASVDNQQFSWSWTTPITEKYQNVKIFDGRDVVKSNFGIYKVQVSTSSFTKQLFFKVSADPANDSLSTTPIFVSTEKSLYHAGEKLRVLGSVIKRVQGTEGLVVPDRVTIQVLDGTFPYKQIHEASVYPNQGGDFSSFFELPPTIFSEGTYTVKTLYGKAKSETSFSVANDYIFGIDDPVSLLVSLDKSEYYPGETVLVSGKPNKLIYLEKFDIGVIKKSDTEITCGSFYCGANTGPITTIRPGPSGSFTYQIPIKDNVSSIGQYEVTVDADFDTKSLKYSVVEKPQTPKKDTFVEKANRISEETIPIFTAEKTTDDVTIAPRVLSGSLITPLKADQADVNLKVSTVTGVCIIGPDADCLVRESTRKPGQIYDVVEVDGISLNVRYSGSDVRLEKFSILPESSTAFLPDANWNVEVLKDDQVSRFYYAVTYKTLE